MTERRGLIAAILSAVGGVSGLVAIALLIWRGGALAQVVAGLEVRVTRIETLGSNGLQIHEAKDNQAEKDVDRRLERLEAAAVIIGRIEAKLDAVKESLDEHKRIISGSNSTIK